jgi:arginase family enzyme
VRRSSCRCWFGFDVVELNPARDPSGSTARIAAWIVTHFLSEIFDARG